MELTPFEIITREIEIGPLTILNKLSRLNIYFRDVTQWRIQRARTIRHKYLHQFGRAVFRRFINHPFVYTEHGCKVVPLISADINYYGIVPFTSDIVFDQDRLIAFSNLSLVTRSIIPFDIFLCISDRIISVTTVREFDYIDLRPDLPAVNPTEQINLLRDGGYEALSETGRYIVNLNLPTIINPIPLGDPFIPRDQLRIGITQNLNTASTLEYVFDFDSIVANISHLIMDYKSSPIPDNIAEYCLAFNGSINSYIRTRSLVRKRSRVLVQDNDDNDDAPAY